MNLNYVNPLGRLGPLYGAIYLEVTFIKILGKQCPESWPERNSKLSAGAQPGAQLLKLKRSAAGAQLRFLPER